MSMAMKLSPAQIGQGVVLLVRCKSLLHGIESAPMTQGTTDFSNHRGQRTQKVRGTSGQVADGQGEAG